jgi:hypothetical protein
MLFEFCALEDQANFLFDGACNRLWAILYFQDFLKNYKYLLQSTADIRHPVGAGQSVSYIGEGVSYIEGKFKGLSYKWG